MAFHLFTSESVSAAHPDKIADRISDAILDALLTQDPWARVAAETLVSNHLVVLAGELTFAGSAIDYRSIVQEILTASGYEATYLSEGGPGLVIAYHQQSHDIVKGIHAAYDDTGEQGAGDQGTMFGYAADETPTLMPLPIYLAHRLLIRHAEVVAEDGILKPDAKSQVTVRYQDDYPVMIDNVVLSSQHRADEPIQSVRDYIMDRIVLPALPVTLRTRDTSFLINPTGSFVIGGLAADSGLTGRKIIVDSYGSLACHGGGAFSGKDPSKVDRSAAYAARYVAKNIVAAGIAQRCSVHVSYAIGVSRPTCFVVNTFGTGIVSDERITAVCREVFDLRPRRIIDTLDLRRPIYLKTAVFGHFGREDPDFYWERTDKIGTLQSYFPGKSFLMNRGSVFLS